MERLNSFRSTSDLKLCQVKLNQPIQVFEHSILKIDDARGFKTDHWTSLGWYNEQYGARFFTLLPNGIRFNQYVGVIQVGNLTIEVLPKIGRDAREGQEDRWQKVLIDMLRECSWMKIHAQEKASLRFKPNSILEAYLEIFLSECEKLLHEGLIKKYRPVCENSFALKGNLLFAQHIQRNVVHQEQFYTRHMVFDRENLFNQILVKTLRLIPLITSSPLLKDRVYNLLLGFPDLRDVKVTVGTFQKLVYDRKTARYREAINIAAMILLNFRPDIISGANHILAILFDMNDLWEEYIARQLRKNILPGWSMTTQHQKPFWSVDSYKWSKVIRPDIVISHPTKPAVIIDTKWKMPEGNIPADTDLKQMFAYNEYWQGIHAILLYPDNIPADEPAFISGSFANRGGGARQHKCSTMKVSVLDNNGLLYRQIGKRIFDSLENNKIL